MVAYSFNKRFVPPVLAGLEPGPWVPGMKRHTLRLPRSAGHARPGQRVDLYTAMRTKQCQLLGRAPAALQVPVAVGFTGERFGIWRRDGDALIAREHVDDLFGVAHSLALSQPGSVLDQQAAESFARADGFADLAEMAAFFSTDRLEGAPHLDMVLIGWAPPSRVGEG